MWALHSRHSVRRLLTWTNGDVLDQRGRVDKCVHDLWTVHLIGDHKASLLSRPWDHHTQGPRKWFPRLFPGSCAVSGVSPLKESLCPVLNSRRRCLSEGRTRGGNVMPSRISGRWMRCQSGHKVRPSADTQTAVVWKMLIFFGDEAALTLAENCAVHYFQRHCCCGYCRAIFSALLTSGRGTR